MLSKFTAARKRSALSFILILSLLGLLTLPSVPVQAQAGQTISDLLSLGANTVREIQETIPLLQGAVQETMQALRDQLEALINTISETYQENLNITINSLDTFTREKLTDLTRLINTVNDKLQEDILLVSQEAQNVMRAARQELEQLSASLQEALSNIIVIGGEAVAFVVDRTFHNLLVIVSLILLGVGLLLFVWSLFRRNLPQGGLSRVLLLLFMALFILLFGAIAFVPTVRAFVMSNTGLGLKQRLETEGLVGQPRLLRVVPDRITLGAQSELEIWGSALVVNNAPPTARIGNLTVPVRAFEPTLLVLDIAGLNATNAGGTGTLNVVLTYPDGVELRGSVRLLTATPTPTPVPSRLFNVTISTGDVLFAGTDASVFITLFGTLGDSPERELDTPNFNDFERNMTTTYAVDAGRNIGTITRIRLRHDNTGFGPGWFVASVRVTNTVTGSSVFFNINRWFARDEDDGRIDRILTP